MSGTHGKFHFPWEITDFIKNDEQIEKGIIIKLEELSKIKPKYQGKAEYRELTPPPLPIQAEKPAPLKRKLEETAASKPKGPPTKKIDTGLTKVHQSQLNLNEKIKQEKKPIKIGQAPENPNPEKVKERETNYPKQKVDEVRDKKNLETKNRIKNNQYDAQEFLDLIKPRPLIAFSNGGLLQSISSLNIEAGNVIILNVNAISSNFEKENNSHWVSLKIDKDSSKIFYIDPLGQNINPEVKETLSKSVLNGYNIEEIYSKDLRPQQAVIINKGKENAYLKGNDKDCGPLLIQSLQEFSELPADVALDKLQNKAKTITDVTASKEFDTTIREQHLKQLEKNLGYENLQPGQKEATKIGQEIKSNLSNASSSSRPSSPTPIYKANKSTDLNVIRR